MQAPRHRRARDLSSEEQLVLWAIRVWVSHFKRGTPPCAGYARCFAMAGAPEVAESLDALLTLTGRHARTAIDPRARTNLYELLGSWGISLGAMAPTSRL